jgi:hypothetical protein
MVKIVWKSIRERISSWDCSFQISEYNINDKTRNCIVKSIAVFLTSCFPWAPSNSGWVWQGSLGTTCLETLEFSDGYLTEGLPSGFVTLSLELHAVKEASSQSSFSPLSFNFKSDLNWTQSLPYSPQLLQHFSRDTFPNELLMCLICSIYCFKETKSLEYSGWH